IAAAMGLVAGLRAQRAASRGEFLTRLQELAGMLVTPRPTAVNLRWALDRMRRVAEATSGDGSDLWERLRVEATTIREEDRAMCRKLGEHGLPILPDGANVLNQCTPAAFVS